MAAGCRHPHRAVQKLLWRVLGAEDSFDPEMRLTEVLRQTQGNISETPGRREMPEGLQPHTVCVTREHRFSLNLTAAGDNVNRFGRTRYLSDPKRRGRESFSYAMIRFPADCRLC